MNEQIFKRGVKELLQITDRLRSLFFCVGNCSAIRELQHWQRVCFSRKWFATNNIGTISSFLFMIFKANKVLGSQQGTNWVILSVFWSSRSTTLCDTTTSTTTTPSETWSTLKLNFLSKAKKNFLTNEKSFCGRLLMVIQFGLNTLLQNHTTGESLWNLSFQSDSNNSNYGFNETNVSLYLFQNFCFITIKLQMSHSMIYVMGYFKSWF